MITLLTILAALAEILAFASQAIVRLKRMTFRERPQSGTRDMQSERLRRIYAPLRASLIDIHITTASSERRPYLQQRAGHAWNSLKQFKMRRAVRELFDRRRSESTEIEFGGPFPLEAIMEVATANADVADPRLQDLIQWARREEMESRLMHHPDDREHISDKELALRDYIFDEYERLANLLGLSK